MRDSRFKKMEKEYKTALDYSVKQHEIRFCAFHFFGYSEMLKTLISNSPVTGLSVNEVIHCDAMRVSQISVEALGKKIQSTGRKDVTGLFELCRDVCDFVESWDRECCNSGTVQFVFMFHVAAIVVYNAVRKMFADEVCGWREIIVDGPTVCFCKELVPPIDLFGEEPFDVTFSNIRLHLNLISKRARQEN